MSRFAKSTSVSFEPSGPKACSEPQLRRSRAAAQDLKRPRRKENGYGQPRYMPVVRSRRSKQRRDISRQPCRPGERCPGDFPGGHEGSELTVEFTVLGRRFVGLNGGPNFTPNESVSFMVVTESQEETDRYWDAIIGNGGVESACSWCKDRWGFSWQITPRRLLDLTTSSDHDKAKRAFEAMMTMVKIDVARIEAAAEAA
jgi:predicted 3-demethylubiquinone-9 3-methyltransferase (glyoxalase superfamily)